MFTSSHDSFLLELTFNTLVRQHIDHVSDGEILHLNVLAKERLLQSAPFADRAVPSHDGLLDDSSLLHGGARQNSAVHKLNPAFNVTVLTYHHVRAYLST